MKNKFEIKGGSIPGVDHTLPGAPGWKNNQDAFFVLQNEKITLGIVADGCSEGEHTEVGSKLAVRLLGSLIMRLYPRYEDSLSLSLEQNTEPYFFTRIREDLLSTLRLLTNQMGDSMTEIVKSYFSFTVVGILVTPKRTYFFSIGDGLISVNGNHKNLGPFPKNEPPYLGFSLLGENIPFVVEQHDTEKIECALIASDGIDYLMKAEGTKNPNGVWTIENISLFWEDDSFLKNSDAIRRKLALYNTEHVTNEGGSPWIKKGQLKDDTTLIVVRKISQTN